MFTAGGYLLRHEDRNGNSLTYGYNEDNTVASVTDVAGRVTTFGYEAGRVSQISDPAGRATRYSYDTVGRLTATDRSVAGSPSRLRSAYEYDSLGRSVLPQLEIEG
ncbi:hypothetical protein [uncultured Aeromicrobium sp.]|uniref:hypothetical protein n=1 Tax=uncultured Aeromicrobium sp. TaxID=337820 RepID=UPI0025DE2608|nr:hypothetical protein [uncultured Aeromicrobium sp.]